MTGANTSRQAKRALIVTTTVLVGAMLVSGCFTTAGNYQRDAEAYIDDVVAEALGASFDSVVCDTPEDQNVGTRFECTALDVDGGTWVFDNEITGDNEFTVNVFSRP